MKDQATTKGAETMTTAEMSAAAKAENEKHAGYNYSTDVLEAAIEEGLVDGDKIGLGGKLVAHIEGTVAVMVNNGITGARVPLDKLTPAQRDRMIVLKAAQCSRRGTEIGAIKI